MTPAGAGAISSSSYLLTHEREMIGGIGERANVKPLGEFAADAAGLDAQGRLAEASLRSEIARFEIDEAAFRLLMRAMGDRARRGKGNPAMSSALKYYGAELNKRRWELMISAAAADALERSEESAFHSVRSGFLGCSPRNTGDILIGF